MKMPRFFSILTLFAASSAFGRATYTCFDGAKNIPPTRFTIEDSGAVGFPNEENLPGQKKQFAGLQEISPSTEDVKCRPRGEGGRWFWNATGSGSWIYRVPAGAFAGLATVTLEIVHDGDNDGIDCRYRSLTCAKD
jgi:hypothetical protein